MQDGGFLYYKLRVIGDCILFPIGLLKLVHSMDSYVEENDFTTMISESHFETRQFTRRYVEGDLLPTCWFHCLSNNPRLPFYFFIF